MKQLGFDSSRKLTGSSLTNHLGETSTIKVERVWPAILLLLGNQGAETMEKKDAEHYISYNNKDRLLTITLH